MSERPVLTERRGNVLVVTINRPGARNAINTAAAEAIAAAMALLDEEPTLFAGVITGAGGTFCAGMDLKAFLAGERPSVPVRGFAGIVESPPDKPIIAAVEGYALAGGFEIALACDLIVAAENAKFGLPEVKRSLVAGGGGLMRLSERIPYYKAMEWALTGDLVDAARADEAGLINRLVPAGQALEAALELAGRIAANGPLAVRASKQIIMKARDWDSSVAFDEQRKLSEPVRSSEDAREGALAFTEKRAPRWRGR
ncbi:enoyl-CoA hydratase [Microbispora rosea subsp. aerata]|nr:crotonase/enoyl-CoA hydratase family protein [Microbispora rosea]GGO20640.1 enoyl-CoA hydratase [Microbispora rosea subsp. aerata]GIH57115.1 enoyl-CoA hydratase [Microbispora rosea subsp. aerata]GLJ84815.1 enoyl-CoA hydratase [Microbispora rosea subsp. aerata]